MAIRVALRHRTTYRYAEAVSASYGQMHLFPRATAGQQCRTSEVVIDPRLA